MTRVKCTFKEGRNFFPRGSIFYLMPDGYQPDVCDLCGKKRKCEWLEFVGSSWTGLDVCRSCLRDNFVMEVVDE